MEEMVECEKRLADKAKFILGRRGRVLNVAAYPSISMNVLPYILADFNCEEPDVKVLSIATRPDCLSPEILELLKNLNHKKPVWVELGLQTIHKTSSDFIRRGYELDVFEKAVYDLKKIGIHVIVHTILCLPGETTEMML